MASVHRVKGSKKWHCSFKDTDGRWRLVSTKCSDKLEAETVCLRLATLSKSASSSNGQGTIPTADAGEFLEAGLKLIQSAHGGQLSEATARDYVNRILKASGAGSEIKGETVASFAENWLAGKELSKAVKTGQRYRTAIGAFLLSLGPRAKFSMASIGARDVEAFRDNRLKAVMASTAVSDIKIVRALFNRARRQGRVHINPCDDVDFPEVENQVKLPFSVPEVALLVAEASPEWKTVILVGFYAGLRLGDAALLDWQAVDFTKGLLTFKAEKTRKVISLPIHPVLGAHLESIAGGAGGPISPTLAKMAIPGRSGLSRQFLDIVREARLGGGPEGEKLTGKRRRFTPKTFHSLRHGFISEMANHGVSKELRMKLAGHSSEDVATGYTHHEAEILRAAIGSIPSNCGKHPRRRNIPY